MAGHRDDGSFAEDKKNHPRRKVSREWLMADVPYPYAIEEWSNPDYDEAQGPPNPGPRRPIVEEHPEEIYWPEEFGGKKK